VISVKRTIRAAETLQKLHAEADGRCHYCRLRTELALEPPHPRAPTRDHKIPVTRGGRWEWDNIALACFRCNNEKSAMTDEEYREFRREVMLGKSHARQRS
jgi:5-methylcytosine-specific restriction endonuclease McrA